MRLRFLRSADRRGSRRACLRPAVFAGVLLLGLGGSAQALLPWKGAGTPRISIVLNHPALLPIENVTRIAIGQISGECGGELTNRITTALVASKKFEVLDRQNFDRIMREHNFNWSGKVDPKTAAALGRALGTAVLVFGEVTRCGVEEGFLEREQGGVFIGGSRPARVRVHIARASLTTSLQLVDLATAKIFTAVVFEGRAEKEFDTTMPDKNAVLTGAYTDVVERFTRLLVPWSHTVDLALYEDGDERWDLKTAALKIRLGEYAQAEAFLRDVVQRNQGRPDTKMLARAFHDLGLALLFSEREAEAVDMLKKAQALRTTPEGTEALQHAQELAALKEQVPTAKAAPAHETTGTPTSTATAAMSRCPYCKSMRDAQAKFCPFCGKSVAATIGFCPKCGKSLPAGARFCPDDGTPTATKAP